MEGQYWKHGYIEIGYVSLAKTMGMSALDNQSPTLFYMYAKRGSHVKKEQGFALSHLSF